jgi:hypothetical protein
MEPREAAIDIGEAKIVVGLGIPVPEAEINEIFERSMHLNPASTTKAGATVQCQPGLARAPRVPSGLKTVALGLMPVRMTAGPTPTHGCSRPKGTLSLGRKP